MESKFVRAADPELPVTEPYTGDVIDEAGMSVALTSWLWRRLADGSLVEADPAPPAPGAHLIWEADPAFSREAITLLTPAVVVAGEVLGRLKEGASAVAAAEAGNVGDGTLTLDDPATTTAVKLGTYRVFCTEAAIDGGTFQVEDPDGRIIGTAKVGVAYTKQIKFTIADGAADFAAGDMFTVTVRDGTGKFVPLDPAATDGSAIAAAIAYGPIDASLADAVGEADLRSARVSRDKLTWPDGISADQQADAEAQLARLGILVR